MKKNDSMTKGTPGQQTCRSSYNPKEEDLDSTPVSHL